jgi:hypothetical protein
MCNLPVILSKLDDWQSWPGIGPAVPIVVEELSMVESLSMFTYQVLAADGLVWTMAFIMSAIAGYILYSYVEDVVFALVATGVLYVSILVAHTSFMLLGIFFTNHNDSNVVAAAGAAICSVAAITVIVVRIKNAIADFNNGLRGEG